MTMSQKILAAHAGLEEVKAGQLIEADLDLVLGNDITSPVAINEMKKMDRKTKLFNLKMLLSSCMAFVVAFGVYVAPRACYGWGYEFEIPEELK